MRRNKQTIKTQLSRATSSDHLEKFKRRNPQ